jgi:hypothetical protein
MADVLDGYAQVPNAVLLDSTLTAGARLLYALLVHYAWQDGECFPGQERLARDLGVSDRTVRSYMDELVRRGLVAKQRRGRGATNLYALVEGESRPEADFRSEDMTGRVVPLKTGSLLPVQTGSVLPPTKTQRTKTQETKRTPSLSPPRRRLTRAERKSEAIAKLDAFANGEDVSQWSSVSSPPRRPRTRGERQAAAIAKLQAFREEEGALDDPWR